MNADVPKPYIPPYSMNPIASPFRSGERLSDNWDWQTLDSGQVESVSHGGGVPHRKAMDVVITRKPD